MSALRACARRRRPPRRRSARCLGKSLPRLGSPTWWPARPMRCRPPATEPGRLDLDDEVDGAHVDAELEATRWRPGPCRRPDFSSSSICSRRSRRQRAVVGLDQLVRRAGGRPALGLGRRGDSPSSGELVEAGGQALGQAAGVDEDERRAVRADQLEQAGVHRRPDASGGPGRRRPGRSAGSSMTSPRRAHVLDGDDDLDLERLADAGVDDGDRPGRRPSPKPPRKRAISSSGRWVADRPMRCGGRSRDRCSSRSRVRARWAPRLVAARAWISSTITASTLAQGLPGLRGEHQVERLGRGDEQVGRVADEPAALVGRGVAGAHADGRLVHRSTPRRSAARRDARQRRPQVLLDVDGQGPQRRDVEEPGAPAVLRRAARSSAGRCPTGRRPASCPSRWGPGSACGRRRRWPASPGPGPRWARGRWSSNQARTGAEKRSSTTATSHPYRGRRDGPKPEVRRSVGHRRSPRP